MKKDMQSMKKVAQNCSEYNPCDCSSNSYNCSNATSSHVSCDNCTHYSQSEICDLDLYREILENHNF